MESLTHALAAKALGIIEEVEKLGGMTKAIESGMPKLRIEETAARRQARIDRGEDVIVGVNRFRLPEEPTIDVREVDNRAVREAQVTRLKKIRETRDPAKWRASLDALANFPGEHGCAPDCQRCHAALDAGSTAELGAL